MLNSRQSRRWMKRTGTHGNVFLVDRRCLRSLKQKCLPIDKRCSEGRRTCLVSVSVSSFSPYFPASLSPFFSSFPFPDPHEAVLRVMSRV